MAGPDATEPEVVNFDPWHGHTNWLLANPEMVQPSCVHTAVNAENVVSPVRATNCDPSAVVTMAADPTVANGEAASTVTETTRPDVVAAAERSGSAELPDGEVGLPPHAEASPPIAISEAAWQACEQKRRRLVDGDAESITAVGSKNRDSSDVLVIGLPSPRAGLGLVDVKRKSLRIAKSVGNSE